MTEMKPAGFPGSEEAVAVAASWVAHAVDQRSTLALELGVPLILTLPESSGVEISRVIQRGLVRKTESETAIVDEDARLIVALPRNMPHRSHLQKIIAGFTITSDTEFSRLLAKAEAIPDSACALQCRSTFINFDKADFSIAPSGTVVAFSEMSRVCKLHTSYTSEWGLCFWIDADGLKDIDSGSTGQSLLSMLANDPALGARISKWCGSPPELFAADSSLLIGLGRALLTLGIGLRDEGWSLQITQIGLLNRDVPGEVTSCVVFLAFKQGDKCESDASVIDKILVSLESLSMVDIAQDGATTEL